MENFLSDFNIFLNFIFSVSTSIYNWLTGNVLGEIIIFGVIISIFIFGIRLLIELKQ